MVDGGVDEIPDGGTALRERAVQMARRYPVKRPTIFLVLTRQQQQLSPLKKQLVESKVAFSFIQPIHEAIFCFCLNTFLMHFFPRTLIFSHK